METVKDILEWCGKNVGILITVFLAIFEFTPKIKFRPISALLKWIGKHMNNELTKEIDDCKTGIIKLNSRIDGMETSMNKRMEGIEQTSDINEMDHIRWEILDFANSCRNGRRHTKEEFEHVITQESKYSALLKKTGTENGVFTEQYKYILKLYHTHCENDTFLK